MKVFHPSSPNGDPSYNHIAELYDQAFTDITVRNLFTHVNVADQALLKTGTLEGVRALAGYVYGPGARRFVVVCFVNHRNASRAQPALDLLVEGIYSGALEGAPR